MGYHAQSGKDVYGAIVKLNPKRAKIKLQNGETWCVPYSLLFSVMDGVYQENNHEGLLIEGSAILIDN